MIYVAALVATIIHLNKKAQIKALIAKEALTKVPPEYLDYADVFSIDLQIELPVYTRINNHGIDFAE